MQRDVVAGPHDRLQLARGDHLGEQHRGDLQRLDLLLGIGAARAVLHDEHAERVAAAQDRHAEEGVVDFLARLRLVGEAGCACASDSASGSARSGNQADEALAGRIVVRWTASRLRPSVANSSSVASARST